ncbi:RMI2 protein, partial [Polyodon spathula]|nr:RMI2 protein [Polyodon spathula]
MVWMQGTVLKVTGDQNTTVHLLDETGTFIVTAASSVPRGRPCLRRGKYVAVMGSVQSCTPELVVRAVKMADLSGNPFHQSGWRLCSKPCPALGKPGRLLKDVVSQACS